MRADSLFADEASLFGLARGFSAAIADDGVIFGSPELVVGPRAAHEFFERRRGVSMSWQPRYAVAAASGDLGFTLGEAVATSRGPSGAAVQRFTKYLTVWRKDPNGRWRFVVDGGNARPSPVGE
jgi:ketosteroid isomerase-like protein